MRAAWNRFWYAPIDPAPLALFRQAFAWCLLLYALAWSHHADEWLTAAGYHPPLALDPINGPQLPLLPVAALPFVGALFYASLLAYIFGFARKIVVWVLVAATTYALFVDPISSFTINRLFVIGLLILALAPDPKPDQAPQPAWPTRMLQLTVVGQYFASGLCKTINGDWWGGEDVLFMQIQGLYMTDAAAWMVRTLPHWAWRVQQEIALWFELLAPILFAFRRLRPLAFVLGLGLHLVIAVTMDQLIYFSLQMACFYLLFVPPEWARRLAPGRGEATGA
ncbi:MAG: HTTM domain-containing protein [Enhygromyxa sp.]